MQVLSNRAACYLHLGELVRCVEDCDVLLGALDLESFSVDADPSDAPKLAMRLKAFARRGSAKCQQGIYGEALLDYRRAVSLSPGDPSMHADFVRVSSLNKCDGLKKRADQLFASGELATALTTYTEALAVEPTFVSALSNRAACYLALGSARECADDCTTALQLLAVDPAAASHTEEQLFISMGAPSFGTPTSSGQRTQLPSGPVPPVGSQKRRTWVLKTVARRGAAFAALGSFNEALSDYTTACGLEPNDESLRADMAAIQARALADSSSADSVSEETPEAACNPSDVQSSISLPLNEA